MGVRRRQSTASFLENEHFLPRDTLTYVCVQGVRNVRFPGKFGVLGFPVNIRFEIVFLPYNWRNILTKKYSHQHHILLLMLAIKIVFLWKCVSSYNPLREAAITSKNFKCDVCSRHLKSISGLKLHQKVCMSKTLLALLETSSIKHQLHNNGRRIWRKLWSLWKNGFLKKYVFRLPPNKASKKYDDQIITSLIDVWSFDNHLM